MRFLRFPKVILAGLAAGLAAGLLVFSLVSPAGAAQAQSPTFLSGKIKTAGAAGQALAARIDQVRREAKGGNYFTAYMFESRNRIHSHGNGRIIEQYSVTPQGAKIRVREKNRDKDGGGISTDDSDTASPAGILLLHDAANGGTVLDASVLDPEQTYEFPEAPVYWLGAADNNESLDVLEAAFGQAREEPLKTSLIFLVSCHSGERGYVFLKKTARGSEEPKVRESAVFWMGSRGDARSVADLKDVYRAEKTERVKKQIVFALQMGKTKEAVAELIAIAESDPDKEIRKTAVFWLGQKASDESIKALKGIVEAKDDDAGLKDQAVFAISQLPKDKSVPMLIDIAKTNGSRSVRKKAIFWLGQSGDTAALKFFEDILLKK